MSVDLSELKTLRLFGTSASDKNTFLCVAWRLPKAMLPACTRTPEVCWPLCAWIIGATI